MIIGLTGATGFIGRHFIATATAAGHSVVGFSRRAGSIVPGAAEVRGWEPGIPLNLSHLSVVVHLAGESVLGLWTRKKRAAILESRVSGTRRLIEAMAAATPRPAALICASAVGYYGDRGEELLIESSPRGSGFLSDVTTAWEAEADTAREHGIRTVCGRIGLVLGPDGGGWPLMRRVFDLGLGGRLGSGRQWTAWVHIRDVAGLLLEAATNEGYAGPVNLVAPAPITNLEFTRTVAKSLRRPAMLPVPALLLRAMLREQASLFLASQRVLPAEALRLGYPFAFPTLEAAVADLQAKQNRGDPKAAAVST